MGRSARSSLRKKYLICSCLTSDWQLNILNSKFYIMISIKILTNGKSAAYVGGGNFITQAKPTNFHQFWTQKILLENETVADFKEVTAAERSAIEAADAEWTRPPQSFIDLWNNACIDPLTKRAVGRYNESTGYFELNGLTDITYQQAMDIYRYTSNGVRLDGEKITVYGFAQFRTNLPPSSGSYWVTINSLFYSNNILEVVRLPQCYSSGVQLNPNTRDAFGYCYKLREIINVMEAPSHVSDSYTWNGTFYKCFELETVRIKKLYGNISFAHSPLISSDSISYLVENRTTAHTDVITVTVHADTFAKLTGDTTNPAVAALTPAELAQWQQILTAATAKNISFTTP